MALFIEHLGGRVINGYKLEDRIVLKLKSFARIISNLVCSNFLKAWTNCFVSCSYSSIIFTLGGLCTLSNVIHLWGMQIYLLKYNDIPFKNEIQTDGRYHGGNFREC